MAHQVTELVSIEAWSRYTDSTRPVVIIVTLVVGQGPELILGKAGILIADNEELGASDGTTSDILGNEEELEVIGSHVS